jgi:hypothetical protein
MNEAKTLRKISINARMAIGLHCFERFCLKKQLKHAEIDAFLDYMWELPSLKYSSAFMNWYRSPPPLVEDLLNSSRRDFSEEFREFLVLYHIDSAALFHLAQHIVLIPFGGFFGSPESKCSLKHLIAVLRTAASEGIEPPCFSTFSDSRFEDYDGLGRNLTFAERDSWRTLN